FFFFQAEDGIRDRNVTGVQTCALPILTEDGTLTTLNVIALLNVVNVPSSVMYVLSAFNSNSASTSSTRTSKLDTPSKALSALPRSEERRVGKECRCRRSLYLLKTTYCL